MKTTEKRWVIALAAGSLVLFPGFTWSEEIEPEQLNHRTTNITLEETFGYLLNSLADFGRFYYRTDSEMSEEEQFLQMVYGKMNTRYGERNGAWYFPRESKRRHSREETDKIAVMLLDFSNQLHKQNMLDAQELLCVEFDSVDERYAAIGQRKRMESLANEHYLELTLQRLTELQKSSLIDWLSRQPQGKSFTADNRSHWYGREAEFAGRLATSCENVKLELQALKQ